MGMAHGKGSWEWHLVRVNLKMKSDLLGDFGRLGVWSQDKGLLWLVGMRCEI